MPQASTEHLTDLKDILSDGWLRYSKLYSIVDKAGNKIPFIPNEAQEKLYREMWYLNIILKARQRGFCLDPSTPVLKADLTWSAIRDLRVGDELVSVDEYPMAKGRGQARKMRTAEVQGVVRVYRRAYRIHFADGRTVTCTGQHPWLTKTRAETTLRWRAIHGNRDTKRGKLKAGMFVKSITDAPWGQPDYEDGWFSGMIDGEGSFNRSGTKNCISVSQVDGPVFDRMRTYLESRGYAYRVEVDGYERPSKHGSRPVNCVVINQMQDVFRLLGQLRPSRFAGIRFWEGKELPGKKTGYGYAEIVKIERLPKQELIDLQTSTGTYVANGLVSHNTTAIQLFMLDRCLFNKNISAGVVAHNREDAHAFFRNKIKFGYENLPELVREQIPAKIDAAGNLEFANGSGIRVGTSLRSSTNQYLHISEFGKICAKYPDKAKEIVSGALNTVEAGQFVFIESTGEAGRWGKFFEMCQIAETAQAAGRPLTKMDYKFFFSAWWEDPGYQLAEAVPIDNEMAKYFKSLEDEHEIKLSQPQQFWYAKKSVEQGEKMKQEYPSVSEEAFHLDMEGLIFGKQMSRARSEGRVTDIPHASGSPVYTFWDLGRNDCMAIWFMQRVGFANRFIDYYVNSGMDLESYIPVLREKAEKRGFVYGTMYLPHDASVVDLTRRDNKSRADVMRLYGFSVIIVPKIEHKWNAIEAARQSLSTCYFDEQHCSNTSEPKKGGLQALEGYKREYSDKLGTTLRVPQHNWASNGADAFQQFATGFADSDVKPQVANKQLARRKSRQHDSRARGTSYRI